MIISKKTHARKWRKTTKEQKMNEKVKVIKQSDKDMTLQEENGIMHEVIIKQEDEIKSLKEKISVLETNNNNES